ncbi:MAG TPA: ABC transporter ATP-binding protein [Dehalococcoidia bacterium]|nr:ABC transporter ATP-binding protein [Dehalococcoidia bacterium]
MVTTVEETHRAARDGASIAIRVRGLTKRYTNGTLANDEIDLAVPEGTTLGLLGRNGAGKTTLARQITGELAPTSGRVHVHGIDVFAETMRARYLMGVVPQEAQPYDHLKPREHLALFGRLRGLGRGEAGRRADEMIALLGLGEHLGKTARMLSGGLKRKLLVGTALMGDPPILVLDEPTTGLDPHARREVWALLRALRGRGRTIIMTTHYMEEAEELCDEIALINGGRIYVQGTVESLRARCQNRFKATYEDGTNHASIAGGTSEAVLAEVRRLGIEEFALTKASLEDVYMELTAEALGA